MWASEADLNGTGSLFVGTLTPDGDLMGEQRIIFPGKSFPAGIAFSSDGLQAFVALNNRNTVAVVDAVAKTIVREIPVGLAPLFLRLSPDGKMLFVSNRGGEAPVAGEHRDQKFFDDLLLAHDDLAQFGRNPTKGFVELVHGLNIVVGEHKSFRCVKGTGLG